MTVQPGTLIGNSLLTTSPPPWTGRNLYRGYSLSPYKNVGDVPLPKRVGMQYVVKQSTAVNVRIWMQSSDSGLGLAGLSSSLTVSICKNGDSSFSTITPTKTDLGNGWYNLALTTSHTDTLGAAILRITAPNTFSNDEVTLMVVAWDPINDLAQGLFPTGSIVANGGNGVSTFKTDLIQVTADYWKDAFIVFTSGALIGQVKKITAFDGTTKFITVGTGFTGTPSGGDTFYIVNK